MDNWKVSKRLRPASKNLFFKRPGHVKLKFASHTPFILEQL